MEVLSDVPATETVVPPTAEVAANGRLVVDAVVVPLIPEIDPLIVAPAPEADGPVGDEPPHPMTTTHDRATSPAGIPRTTHLQNCCRQSGSG
jgi:hypothetical protein